MAFFSYAQNFEDVLLWRALKSVEDGFYIDIGAWDPNIDSVSKGFYEQGWRGIHVEPNPVYAEKLEQDRPDERVLRSVVVQEPGQITYYELAGTGMSTIQREIAEHHRANGWQLAVREVEAITLDDIFAQAADRDVHWLKIDIEGSEFEALKGWTQSKVRPWVILVEAIDPTNHALCHQQWEPLLLEKDYRFAYFDGVNRYYVSAEHAELIPFLDHGPCVLDEIRLASNHWIFKIVGYPTVAVERMPLLCEQLAAMERARDELAQEVATLKTRIADIEANPLPAPSPQAAPPAGGE